VRAPPRPLPMPIHHFDRLYRHLHGERAALRGPPTRLLRVSGGPSFSTRLRREGACEYGAGTANGPIVHTHGVGDRLSVHTTRPSGPDVIGPRLHEKPSSPWALPRPRVASHASVGCHVRSQPLVSNAWGAHRVYMKPQPNGCSRSLCRPWLAAPTPARMFAHAAGAECGETALPQSLSNTATVGMEPEASSQPLLTHRAQPPCILNMGGAYVCGMCHAAAAFVAARRREAERRSTPHDSGWSAP
jgi:hypothetical protein